MLMSRKQMNAVINMQPAERNKVKTRKYLCENLYTLEGTWEAVSEMSEHERKVLKKIIALVEKEEQS
jgi:hypothetical protein